MSRSYKKTPGWTDQQRSKVSKWHKRQANRRVRHASVVPRGGGYKKYYCSWIICDFKFLFYSKKEFEELGWGPRHKYYMK